MMQLLETMNVMESIIVKVIFKGTLKTCHIISNIIINCPKDPLQVSIKIQRIFTNKSPWGRKAHGNMCCWFCRMHTTQPKGTSLGEQAQSKRSQHEAEDWK